MQMHIARSVVDRRGNRNANVSILYSAKFGLISGDSSSVHIDSFVFRAITPPRAQLILRIYSKKSHVTAWVRPTYGKPGQIQQMSYLCCILLDVERNHLSSFRRRYDDTALQ